MEDIREVHGVLAMGEVEKSVRVTEREQFLTIRIYDGIGAREAHITPNEARALATKLHRIAGRVARRL